MDRRIGQGLRAGAAAVGVSAGLMVLASTTQTPDGFIHASFGGPLDIFAGSTAEVLETDVLAIGDGPNDATELAALLKGPVVKDALPDSPYRVAYEAGSTPETVALNVYPAPQPVGAPATKQALEIVSKPVVDSQGRVDCTGSVSCEFDPATNVTTVKYADGVIALVQKVNEMTVVAYRTAAENLQTTLQALLPPSANQVPQPAAAAPAPTQATVPTVAPAPTSTASPTVDPGPSAPDPVITEVIEPDEGPTVTVTRPPADFTPGRGIPGLPNGGNPPKSGIPSLDKIRDTLESAAKSVGDSIGKALGGASTKPGDESE